MTDRRDIDGELLSPNEKKLLVFEVTEAARDELIKWTRRTLLVLLVVVAVLGLRTWWDIQNQIGDAVKKQLAKASEQTDSLIVDFNANAAERFERFDQSTKRTLAEIESELKHARERSASLVATFERESGQKVEEFRASSQQAIQDFQQIIASAQSEVDEEKQDFLASLEILDPGATGSPAESEPLNPKARVRPVRPGLSISGAGITRGTICCIVIDREGVEYLLTAGHVVGDPVKVGDQVVQPGRFDGGSLETDVIATVERVIELDFSAGAPNLAQAALLRILPEIEVAYDLPELGPIRGVRYDPQLGEMVQMYGSTSRHTRGQITDLDFSTTSLRFRPRSGGPSQRAGFRDLILATKMAEGGDGGAAVLDVDHNLIALHFAGSPSASIFVKIANVFEALDVQLVGPPKAGQVGERE